MASSSPAPKDHWTSQAYTTSASFVPALASKVTQWLAPQPNDKILDLGCGDAVLTSKIKTQCAHVDGLDASPNLVQAAGNEYGEVKGLSFRVQDCRYLEKESVLEDESYDRVFSNAALHWILRDPSTRMSVLGAVHRALKPGGTFAFEMGGKGNVSEVHTALLAALVHHRLGIERVREASPWFFPSEGLMKAMLEEVGFVVERCEMEYRPTRLTADEDGGLEGWVRLMGAHFLELVDAEKQESVVREVCDVLESVLKREEDGSMWLGYVRLRILARK